MLSNDRERRLQSFFLFFFCSRERLRGSGSRGVTYGSALMEGGGGVKRHLLSSAGLTSSADDGETTKWANERDGGIW